MSGYRPLLVGEANPYGVDPAFALWPLPENASGGRLCRILGLPPSVYLDTFDRANLCPSSWSKAVAMANAKELLLGPQRYFVLLGRKVATAFAYGRREFFTRDGYFLLLPHPSGLCQLWNDPENVRRAREMVAELLEEAFRA